jgi:hypothetical protein
MDWGDYDQAWEASGPTFKKAIGRDRWNEMMAERSGQGRVTSRRVVQAQFIPPSPGLAAGEYFAVRYDVGFS